MSVASPPVLADAPKRVIERRSPWGTLRRKLGVMVLVVWGAATLIFLLVRIAPGSPATVMLGSTASASQIEAFEHRWGLDRPLPVQYGIYVREAVTGDFGYSVRLGKPAMSAVLERLPDTLLLTGVATVVAVAAGIPLGIVAGRRPGGWVDRCIAVLALTVKSMPGFWLGVMLILLFAGRWSLVPSFGSGTWKHLVLPSVTLALPFLAMVVRLMRSSVVETLDEPFVHTARAKGIGDRAVLFGHVARNSLLPVVTVIGLQIGTLLGGAVVTESVFSWPGLGQLLVQSVNARDYTVVQSIAIVVAVAVVVVNALTDLLYQRLDPRIRVGARQ